MNLASVMATVTGGKLDKTAIIAASPITYQPASNPYRIVLRYFAHGGREGKGQFVVHNQIWCDPKLDTDGKLDLDSSDFGFENGDYFNADELVPAMKRWVERVNRDIGHLPSMYRRLEDVNAPV